MNRRSAHRTRSIHRAALGLSSAALFAAASAIACAPASTLPAGDDGTGDTELGVATQYLFAGDFLAAAALDAELDAWRALQRTLESQFDDICGDTFCEGDYSNLYSLGFECSVTSKLGKLRECVWTFAASEDHVDAATGSLDSRVPFFECRVHPEGKLTKLLPALAGDPLDSQLPGLGVSLYELLGDCFEAPIFVDEQLPAITDGPFQSASDLLAGADVDAWYAMTATLRQNFDGACGDTFCEGDYPNLQPLRFRCSADPSTQRIGECAWLFAGSNAERTKKGFITVDKAPFACKFPVDATAAELAQALAPDACGEDPLHRALPGSTTSIFDALGDCL